MQARFESISIIWVFVKSKYFIKKTSKIFQTLYDCQRVLFWNQNRDY